jgi:hypothetical protein
MSQLYILEEYMHRLEHKLGRKVLPRDHFDLIAAVDSSRQVIHGYNTTLLLIYSDSSPIAIFLGLFGMSVEDAQEAFHDVYTAVFKNETESPETRALILENEIKKLLDTRKLPHTTRMSDFCSPDSSKVYVVMPDARLITA